MSNNTPQYQPGDVVNGHQLVAHEDGRQEWVPLPAPIAAPTVATGTKRKSRRGLWITLGAVGGVLLLIIIIGSLNRPSSNTADEAGLEIVQTTQKPTATKKPTSTPKPAAEMVTVPAGLVGMTANDAYNALAAVGLKAVYDGAPTAKVLSVSPPVAEVIVGSTITLAVEQPPALSVAQQNAVSKGRSYLAYSGFSRIGLIEQLQYEGYSAEDATFAADFIAPDWAGECAEKAKAYMQYSAFSRDGLYEQLSYEGFGEGEIAAGLAAVGY